jgi:hypothetical protein
LEGLKSLLAENVKTMSQGHMLAGNFRNMAPVNGPKLRDYHIIRTGAKEGGARAGLS